MLEREQGLAILREAHGAREGGHTLRKDVFLPSKHLLSGFYEKLPSKNPSKNLVFTENPLQARSKNPSKNRLLLENLLRTLLRVACGCMTPLVCALEKHMDQGATF